MIFVYASIDSRERFQQWEFLKVRKPHWGSHWVLGGNLNDIKNNEKKKGGSLKTEHSFMNFRNFLADMEMGDIRVRGEAFTWANNRETEGYIQERLNRFCGSVEWMGQHENATVCHVLKQTSDHAMLILDTNPEKTSTKGRFI